MFKKIISILLLLLIVCATAPCYAVSELYYVKNVSKSTLDNNVNNILLSKNYKILSNNPFHAVKTANKDDYIIIILRQSGQNVFYYYTSNHFNRVGNNFLNQLSEANIEYLKSTNQNLLSSFDETAQKILSGNKTSYSFDVIQQNNSTSSDFTYKGHVEKTGKGTKIDAYLQNPINTATASVGDSVQAVVKSDWIVNNRVIAPQGSLISGTLTKAQHASVGMRNGKVVVNFTQIVTPENKTYDISAKAIEFDVSNDGVVTKTLATLAIGAAAGALLGLLVGVAQDNGSAGKGAAIGAGVGAGTVLVASGVQKGIDAEIPSYTDIEIEVTENVHIIVKE